MSNEKLVALLEDMTMLLSNLIDPKMRALQVASLTRDETIMRLKTMREDCRGYAEKLDCREAPEVPREDRTSLN